MRCAIYARYSSDLQRESSIDDQIRKCTQYAKAKGWSVVEEYVLADCEISGAALAGRTALIRLQAAVKQVPRPFDKLLVDDTSRLSRSITDGMNLIERFNYCGVSVVSVSQGIDSQDKSARQLFALNGIIDEQYLTGLSEKVHRGQEGRVRKGLIPGGRCFGYRNVPIEDLSRPGKYGRPAVSGVRVEIIEHEAAIVRRIFQMSADGMGLARIGKQLNDEGILSPQTPRGRMLRAWCPSSIREILRNERYQGVQVWNRTVKTRNPETGLKTSKPRPESQWVRTNVPEWRIVSEDLWNAVHARIKYLSETLPACRQGGLNRTESSRRYLFSGILMCGICGAHIVIVSGRGRRGYVKYGCPGHRYRGVCPNKLTIRQDRLEEQLLGAIEAQVLKPEMLNYTLKRVREEVDKRMREMRKQAGTSARMSVQEKRKDVDASLARIADAIAAVGHSPTLVSRLKDLEAERDQLTRVIEMSKPTHTGFRPEDMEQFVMKKVTELKSLLGGDVTIAKAALQKHVQRLVLTPQESPSGPVYAVSGGVDLVPIDVMPVVSCDLNFAHIRPPFRRISVATRADRSGSHLATNSKSCPARTGHRSAKNRIARCVLDQPGRYGGHPRSAQ